MGTGATVWTMKQLNDPLWRFAQRLQSHCHLSEPDIRAVLDLPHALVSRRSSSYLVREGDEVRTCAVLVSGYAIRHRTTGEGNRQVVAIYVPGDPLDLDHLYLPVADDDLQVAKTANKTSLAEFALIPHEAIRELMARRAAVAEAVMTASHVDMAICREWLLNIGQRDSVARVAHLLCELAVRMEVQGLDADTDVLPLSQILIAEATGLTPAHVNRTLRALQSEGVITRKDQLVRFPDWRVLAKAAGFDPNYLFTTGPAAPLQAVG